MGVALYYSGYGHCDTGDAIWPDLFTKHGQNNVDTFDAIYGRRRVGKTHLIREYCEPRVDLFFDVTGQKDAATKIQLFHFIPYASQRFARFCRASRSCRSTR